MSLWLIHSLFASLGGFGVSGLFGLFGARRLLFESAVKYFLAMFIAVAAWGFLSRNKPVVPVAKPIVELHAAAPVSAPAAPLQPASSNALKSPLDRTHQVLDQARKQQGENAD